MQVHTFIAESAVDAVTQIRQELGAEAVVLNLRRLPVQGLARLWQKPRIEVLATLPEKPAPPSPPTVTPPAEDALAGLRQELAEIKERVAAAATEKGMSATASAVIEEERAAASTGFRWSPNGWRVGKLLESSGLLPRHIQRVLDELHAATGAQPPESLAAELDLTRRTLADLWRPSRPFMSNTHVFVGPPGAGKTTALCKWLARSVLVENRPAHVWRLDGRVANTAESLSVYAEVLGVPLERFAPAEPPPAEELLFIDLPGINTGDPAALNDFKQRLGSFPDAQVHLVLNAAYEWPLLLAQARAFAALPVDDVILTHLDEEPRWGKLWNFVLGTNYTVRFTSAGQNVPGDFQEADAEKILARQFPRK